MGLPAEKLSEEAMGLEEAVREAVTARGGDPYEALRALLTANTYLHHEVERLRALVSPGFAQGKLTN